MEATTLSDLFDTRLNSFSGGIQKDEYEKSLYLTRAQDIYYDAILDDFEVTNTISEKVERLLEDIEVDTFTLDSYGGYIADFSPIVARKILRERVQFTNDLTSLPLYRGKESQVKEDRLSEIENSLENPFRLPSLDFINRVIKDTLTFSKVSLYIPVSTMLAKYKATVAKEPAPIILETLIAPLEIRGSSVVTTNFEFKDKDLDKILEIAVSLVLKDLGYIEQSEQQAQQQRSDSSRK